MNSHPFSFTSDQSFTCADPHSVFVFEPAKGKFHWCGRELDKIGDYKLVVGEQWCMELLWNYGREQTYTVVSSVGVGDNMSAFVLKNDKTGHLYSFSR